MELLTDPSIWVSLVTLIILEVVLGIDNLVFITILADKLPPHQRNKARKVGLFLAMFIRLLLLSVIAWVISLKEPIFTLWGNLSFSGRDLILIGGGFFLLFKATTELHERLEAKPQSGHKIGQLKTSFFLVIAQILMLDVVFSLDSVITAVGMTEHLPVMMAAVIVAVFVMLLAANTLGNFVGKHPTVIVLCLSFLLMIGFSLVLEGFKVHVPKGYLYAAIGFSIMIEFFNQMHGRNAVKEDAKVPIRLRAISKLSEMVLGESEEDPNIADMYDNFEFEKKIMAGVLSLAERPLKSLMVKKDNIIWLNLEDEEKTLEIIKTSEHKQFPIAKGNLNNFLGLALAKDILLHLKKGSPLNEFVNYKAAEFITEKDSIYKIFKTMKKAQGSLLVVKNINEEIIGLLSPLDLLEALAGEFPSEYGYFKLKYQKDGSYLAHGNLNMYLLEQELLTDDLVSKHDKYVFLNEFLKEKLNKTLEVGDVCDEANYRFTVLKVNSNMEAEEVKITKLI